MQKLKRANKRCVKLSKRQSNKLLIWEIIKVQIYRTRCSISFEMICGTGSIGIRGEVGRGGPADVWNIPLLDWFAMGNLYWFEPDGQSVYASRSIWFSSTPVMRREPSSQPSYLQPFSKIEQRIFIQPTSFQIILASCKWYYIVLYHITFFSLSISCFQPTLGEYLVSLLWSAEWSENDWRNILKMS